MQNAVPKAIALMYVECGSDRFSVLVENGERSLLFQNYQTPRNIL
ncbi:hypothetical protein [Nodularia sp. UHCC 0506]|nr:hypothetical protein [Nodularia sp. UHCC 0506]MEA5516674.1 hypothetical protein [Nodularia sp. UHCC 0506]